MNLKAICIDNKESDSLTYNLTIGKVYTIVIPEWANYDYKDIDSEESFNSWYEDQCGVIGDDGREILVPQSFFKLLDEWRREQIDQLLK